MKLFAIGDCLNATPALRGLRDALPDARIDVLVGKWSAAVFRNSPHSNRLIEVEDTIFRSRNLKGLVRLIAQLRREKYDALFLFHRDPKLGLFFGLTGVPVRIGLDLEGDGYFNSHPVHETGVSHEVRIYNSLVEAAGIKVFGDEMEIFPTTEQCMAAESLWAKSGLGEFSKAIGMTPGGAFNPGEVMPQRIWPHYGKLAERLVDKGFGIAWFGGPGDRGAESQLPKRSGMVSFIGECDLLTSGELMRRCSLIVTHDSGPMHLAAAAGARTLSLFAPTDPLRKAPLGARHRYMKADLHCSPCYHRGKWPESCTQECIGSISVEQVLEITVEMVGEK